MTSAKRARRRSKRQSTAAAMQQQQQQVVIRLDAADAAPLLPCAACTKGYARVAKWKQEISFPLSLSLARSPMAPSKALHMSAAFNNFIIYQCQSSRTHFYYIVSLSGVPLSLFRCVRETERNGAFLFTSTENCCGSGFIRELLQNIVWWYDKIECNKACRRSLSDPGTKYTLINFVFLPAALIIFCSQCNSNSAYRHAGEKAIKSRKKDASTLKTSLSFTQIVIFTSRPGGKITQGERGTLFAECSKAMCLKQNCRKRSENHNTARAV